MRGASRLILLSTLVIVLAFAGRAAAQQGGDPTRGGELFVQNCAMCHGIDGSGRIGANLEAFPGIQADAAIRETIASGIEGSPMPAWGEAKGGPLSDADIEDITAYVIGVLGGTEPVAPAPEYIPPEIPPLPDVEGDPSAGALVFQQNCVACHGERGEGRIGKTLAKAWPGNQPAVYLVDVISHGIEGTVMPGWGKDAGGPLSEDQVADVAAYVLTLSPAAGLPTPAPPASGPFSGTISLIAIGLIALAGILILVVYYRRA